MSTTAIFAELLVIGIQTAFWVALLAMSLAPALVRSIDLSGLKEWEGLITASLFAVCYSLGVLVDRLADVFALAFRPSELIKKVYWLRTAQSKFSDRKLEDAPVKLVKLALKEGKALEYFDYFRSRIRITRALTINSALTALAAICFGLVRRDLVADPWVFILTVCFLGGGISVASFLATGMLDLAYETRRTELSHLLEEAEKSKREAAEPTRPADD